MINKSHVAPACEPITRLYLRSGEIRETARRGKYPVDEFLIRNTTKRFIVGRYFPGRFTSDPMEQENNPFYYTRLILR